ncbi:MAG: amidophosphoribosyltransferase [Desulfurococcaceae archaeon]
MCGIIGVFKPGDLKEIFETMIKMLINLQHRGQEGYGFAIVSNELRLRVIKTRFHLYDFMWGIDKYVKSPAKAIAGIAHARYSTTGEYSTPVQPVVISTDKIKIAMAFNGTIANYAEIFEYIGKEIDLKKIHPSVFDNDSTALAGVLLKLVMNNGYDVIEALKDLPSFVNGAYSLVVLTNEPRIVVARDLHGFHPLVYAVNDGFYVASENPALEVMGLQTWREVGYGEIISYDGHVVERTRARGNIDPSPCVFEYVYFSRPDTVFNNISVYDARFKMGELLATVEPVDGDVVIPVPEGGRIIALGYSSKSGIPYIEGLFVNRYVGRGFITPPNMRSLTSSLKYNAIKTAIQGQRVILIDDSIVRGTTMRQIVSLVKFRGALEVHARIASPPFKCPCYMGIDVYSKRELAFSNNIEDVKKLINADSLAYNTLENLSKAIGLPRVCHACFSCLYPIPLKYQGDIACSR